MSPPQPIRAGPTSNGYHPYLCQSPDEPPTGASPKGRRPISKFIDPTSNGYHPFTSHSPDEPRGLAARRAEARLVARGAILVPQPV